MAMAIAAPPPIWCIPTPSDNAQCFVAIFSDSSGDLYLYGKIQAVIDHISGMTDVYALDLYRKLNGMSLPAV